MRRSARLGTISPRVYLRWLAVAISIVSAFAASCPAAAANSSHNRSAAHNHIRKTQSHRQRRAPRVRRQSLRGQALLAFGSGYSLRHGSPAVRAVQRRLASLGYPPGPIDGRFGPRTQAAVLRLQVAHGLVADGIVGPLTRAALADPGLGPGAGYGLPRGSRAVRGLQRLLVRLGCAPGPLDGLYGPLTKRAVERFQRRHRLPVSGIVGSRTQRALEVVQRHRGLPALQPLGQIPPLAHGHHGKERHPASQPAPAGQGA